MGFCEAQKAADFDAIGMFFETTPVHFLVPDASQRMLRAHNLFHVCSRQLPSEMFCSVAQQLFVASPELALALMAKELPPFEFVDLCMEFMGTYALREDLQRGFATRREPLATRATIISALEMTLGKRAFRGTSLLLEHAIEGSRSPMETREYLLLFLPKKYGGYGLPKAKMNARVELSHAQRIEAGRSYVECDLYWPDHKIAIEYDGDYDHASYNARMRDATKRNVLHALGIRQFTLTAPQILDESAFDAFVRNIAAALGFRLRDYPTDWTERRETLRNALFRSMKRTDRK